MSATTKHREFAVGRGEVVIAGRRRAEQEQELTGLRTALDVQFRRIAQMQAELDSLKMTVARMSPTPTPARRDRV